MELNVAKFNGMEELEEKHQEQIDGGLAHLYWIGVGVRVVYQAARNPVTRKAAANLAKSAWDTYAKWVGYGAAAGAAKKAWDR